MGNVMVIRRATGKDAGMLSDIAFHSKAYWGYSDAFMAACRHELTYSVEDVLAYPFYLLETAVSIAGFYALYPHSETAVELEALFVNPESMGLGAGRRLMTHAKQTAVSLQKLEIVILSDPNAAKFYEKMGAKHIGKRPSGSIAGRTLPLYSLAIEEEDG